MTDEAAFLKAIHDAPADDAPRLVFADWLDEQGDARGRFLRNEVHAAGQFRKGKPDAAKKLRKEAETMGLEWALAVARPPVGVCTSVKFAKSGAPVSPDTVDTSVRKSGITLPPDYRAFLLLHNGGHPTPKQFEYKGNPSDEPEMVQEFIPFKPKEGFVSVLELYQGHMDIADMDYEDVFASTIAIGVPGMEEDCLSLSVAGKRFGTVYYQPYVEGLQKPIRIADSFSEFLGKLGKV